MRLGGWQFKYRKIPSDSDIDDVVSSILAVDGPDGHIDGHEILTAYIQALLRGEEDDWVRDYVEHVPAHRRHKLFI